MISQHRTMTPPRQTLNYSPKSSRAGTPVRHSRRSVSASTPRRGNKARRASPGRQRKFSNRVLDVTPLFTLEGAVRYVEVVNEHTAWTAKCDGSVGVRSIPRGDEIRQLCGREGAFCTCLLFVEKTGKIWAVFSDGFIRIYDAAIFAFEREFVQHDGSIECIVALEDRIYTGGRDWKIYQWIPDNYSYERQLSGHGNTVRCFCPYNGSTGAVLFSGSDDGTVKAWNPYAPTKQSKESNPCIHTFLGHSRGVLSLELVTPNNQLWSGGEDSTIRVWDLNSLNCVSVLEGHTSPIGSLMLLGNRLWSGDKRGRILLWDINTLLPLQELSQATGMNPRSILCMRTMMSSLVWKVWTTTSSGQIHCWNADSVSMILRNDASEDTSPHMLEESVRVLERDNEFLRGEIAKMARQLEKESARVKQEQLNSAQTRQLAMDASECLRRQVRERARSKSPTSSVGADALDISPQTSYLSPRTRPEESPKPLSEMSHVRWKLGDAMERSSLNLMMTPTTMSIDVDDGSSIVVTNYKRLFPGTAWSEVLATNEKELRSAFAGEVARSIGLTEDRLQHVYMQATPQGLLAAVDIPHTSPTRSEDIQSHLDKYPFPSVLALYGSVLEIKNEDLKRSLAQFQKEKDSIREQNRRDNVNDTTTTRAQSRETADILDELETTKRKHQELQRRFQQISEQETHTRSNFNIIQEEYDALKNLVENRLKPRISGLERMNGEKDLDLRANEETIKRLKRELEQLQAQRREGQERNGGSNARLQEEYDALKNLVENRLKPRISGLERMNGEKDLDLRANEETIKQLKRENEQLQAQRREGQERNGGSNARLQEEYDALKNLVENRLKPRISGLERMNGEKDLDLRANEETIKKLMEKYEGGHSVIVESGGGIEEIKGERDALLEALMESQESARLREVDLMSFVNSLQDAAERNVAEKEELVASLEAMKSELRKVSKERDVAVADAELLQDEYMKLRDHILAELRPHFANGDGRLLGAYLNEVQRRRAAENELYRGQRGGGATHPNTTVAGSGADRSSITLCLRDMEKVTEDLRSSLEDAMHRLNVAEGCCVKMRSLVPH